MMTKSRPKYRNKHIYINYGCGENYREGWINIDINPKVKTDILIKLNERLPFANELVDFILCDNVLEHLEPKDVLLLLKEFHRVLHPKGRIEIYVPHFTGILVKYLGHHKGYGVNSFCDERDMFNVIEEKLILISRCRTAGYKFMRFLNVLNPIFNINRTIQQISEKYLPGGFEEIKFVLEKKE
jgi:SAM-dependent methyltransferase